MKNVIVTGAAGIVGAVLTRQLSMHGYHVFAIVRPQSKSNQRIENIPNVQIIPLAMEHIKQLPDKIGVSCETIIHLAWSPLRNDFQAQAESFSWTLAIMDMARLLNCKRFLGIGSQAEYGICTGLTTEDTPLNPTTFYGAFKAAASQVTKVQAQNLGIDWLWGRIFSIYGIYEPPSSLISYMINTLKQEESPKLSSCLQYWDYLYDQDAAEAIIAIMEHGISGNVYNIAHGDYKSLKYYTEILHQLFNPNIEVTYGPKTGLSIMPDTQKLTTDTGWKAHIDFAEGIKSIRQFF